MTNCLRCGRPHTQADWDEIFQDWVTFFVTKKQYKPSRAAELAHREMKKHGQRPGGEGPPLGLRLGAFAFGGGEAVKFLVGLWRWLNGKKTLIASILIGVPVIWDELAKIFNAAGMPDNQIVAIGAIVLLVTGWIHKLLKVTGVAEKPEK